MKIIIIIALEVFLFSLAAAAQSVSEVPGQAVLSIKIIDLPGIKIPESTWEMSYELRIVDQDELVRLVKSGELMMEGSSLKHGELIAKGIISKKKDLSKPENLAQILQFPLDENVRGKLKNQIKSSDSLPARRQSGPQIFLLYANALVYDAKLKKTIIIPFNWVLPFDRHPTASFETTIQILEDGSFTKRVILSKDKQNQLIVVKN